MGNKYKTAIAYVILLALSVIFCYLGMYKIFDLKWFGIWIKTMPNLHSIGVLLKYSIPILELLIAIGLLIEKIRITTLYILFCYRLIIVSYLIYVFLFEKVFTNPYKTLLPGLTWLQFVIFSLSIMFLALLELLILENKFSMQLPRHIKYLRSGPAEVH